MVRRSNFDDRGGGGDVLGDIAKNTMRSFFDAKQEEFRQQERQRKEDEARDWARQYGEALSKRLHANFSPHFVFSGSDAAISKLKKQFDGIPENAMEELLQKKCSSPWVVKAVSENDFVGSIVSQTVPQVKLDELSKLNVDMFDVAGNAYLDYLNMSISSRTQEVAYNAQNPDKLTLEEIKPLVDFAILPWGGENSSDAGFSIADIPTKDQTAVNVDVARLSHADHVRRTMWNQPVNN